jgi:hypothetical protein
MGLATEVLTGWPVSDLVYARDLAALMYSVYSPLSACPAMTLMARQHSRPGGERHREPRIGAGIFASVDALARMATCTYGAAGGRRENHSRRFRGFGPSAVAGAAGLPVVNDSQDRFGGGSSHYGLLWWNNGDGALADVPRDAFWGYGLGDSLVAAIPSLDIVVARSGSAWPGSRKPSYYRVLAPFLGAIIGALRHGA